MHINLFKPVLLLNLFDRLNLQYTVHINLFKPVLFMHNWFYKHPHPMQIIRFQPGIFMLNRFEWLNLQYTIQMQINRYKPV